MNVKKGAILFAVTLFVAACTSDPKIAPVDAKKDSVPVVPAVIINKDSLLSKTGQQILMVLKAKQYDSLVHFVAAGDSVHFSPYGFIGSGTQTLSAGDLLTLLSENKKIRWGSYDGSGDPILLSLKEYIEKFVYNADFSKAPHTTIDSVRKAGNSLNNLKQVYPDNRYIEYYFSGFEKKYAGMDWTSLILVFKELNNRYYLVAIVHDQWTT